MNIKLLNYYKDHFESQYTLLHEEKANLDFILCNGGNEQKVKIND